MTWISLKFFLTTFRCPPSSDVIIPTLFQEGTSQIGLISSTHMPLHCFSSLFSVSLWVSLCSYWVIVPRQRRQFAQSPFNQIIRYWYCRVSEGVWKRSVCSSTTYCQTDVWYPYKDKKPPVRSQEYSAHTIYWHIMIQVSVIKYKSLVEFTYAD